MKYFKTIAVAAGLACAAASSRADITLQFSTGTTGGDIDFTGGGNFSFVNGGGGSSFQIGTASGSSATGDSFGDLGSIAGTFQIGTISGSTATVNGAGTLSINDGLGHDLTGTVTWSTIGNLGTGNTLNVTGLLNLSTITYSGTQKDLQALAGFQTGEQVVSFSFAPPESLADLAAGGLTDTISGQISAFASTNVLPEPTTVIAGALLLLPFGLGAVRSFRKNSTSVE
jgi:hypothetical protein